MKDDAIIAVLTNGNIRKFLEKVAEDVELQAKLSKIRDPHEAYKLAVGVQDGFTEEEFTAVMKKLYAEVTKDLSEEDLAKLAGGLSPLGKGAIVFGTTVVSCSAAAAAAQAST